VAIFNKKSPEEKTITELEEYYSGKKNRPIMAWIMAIISLLITVAVVSGLFFGGRWVYQKIAHRNDTKQTTTQTTSTASSNSSNTNSATTPSNSSNKESSTDFPSVVSDQAASTSVPSNVRNTSTTNSNIPNTGPGESALVVIASVFVLSYRISLRKQKANQ